MTHTIFNIFSNNKMASRQLVNLDVLVTIFSRNMHEDVEDIIYYETNVKT